MAAGINPEISNKSEGEKALIHSFDMLLLLSMLKMRTGDKLAVSVSEMTRELNDLFSEVTDVDSGLFAERTLYRKVDLLAYVANTPGAMNDYIRNLLLILTGGEVRYRSARGIESGVNTAGKGSQRRYYFEPLLTESDLDMVCASIMSSRYLTGSEKNYLLSRLKVLKSGYDAGDRDQINSSLFTRKDAPRENALMLSNIRTIYEAIRNEHRIEVIYGIYDIREGSSLVDFHPRNADRPYILNPYAMLWNDGEYYLVATHRDYENPSHFRIDRMIDVRIHLTEKKDKSGKTVYVPQRRNRIPPTLSPFFHRQRNLRVFDAIAYTNTYPDMKIYGEKDLVDCCFECTPVSLQILIDNFGRDLRLGRTPLTHSGDGTDINGKPLHYLTATVSGVQRECAADFAITHSEHLTLLSPSDLAEEVRERLKAICEKYSRLPGADQ